MDTAPQRNFALVVGYDGTDFRGFQYQPAQRTVQGELETALGRITSVPTRVHGAGRTDSGVHATGQVVNFTLHGTLDAPTLVRALNAVLPEDIAVSAARQVEPAFHARFSADARTYAYAIWNAPSRCPVRRRVACYVRTPLSVDAMAEAMRGLVGTHDFAAFSGSLTGYRGSERVGPPSTVRHVSHAEWHRRGSAVILTITANAFLPHMVRNIVGASLFVGLGKRNSDDVRRILASRDRRLAPPPAPAQGLCLTRVHYPEPDWAGSGSDDGPGGDILATLGYHEYSGLHREADGPIPEFGQ